MHLLAKISWKSALPTLALALLLSLVAVPAAFAQGVTTGSISGLVTDADGTTALPGAIVTAVHVPTGTRYNTVTRADGRFRILGVRVGGPYTVTASLDGFRPQEDRDLFVQLGEDLFLDFQLQLETVEETLTVVGTSNPLINPNKTGSTSQVGEEAIVTLPTLSRGLEDFTRTNPFFANAAENENPEAISVAGRSGRYNNIQIDGSVNNDLFGLAGQGTPGGQTETQPISIDAIQEIQLVLAPFDVRQGGFTGGGVNAITKSGSNQFNGSIYYFNRDQSLVGDLGEREFGDFSEDQYGFSIGGPISRDKVFFFVNAEKSDKTTPTGWSIDGSGGLAFGGNRNAEVLAGANLFRQALIDRYGYDPGGVGQDSRDTTSDKIFARLDFNLGASHTLTLRHNYIDAGNDVNFPGSRTFEFPSEAYLITNKTNSTVAQLNSVISPTMFNELRLANQTIKDRRGPRNGINFPWIEIENVIPGTGLEFEAGTEPFSTRNALDQDILELTDDFTWILGNHSITLGTHNEFFTFDNLFIQNAFGAYEFSTLDDFLAGNPSRRYNYTIVPPGQSDSQKFEVNQFGFYAGDQWTPKSNLTISYGLRVDIPYFPDQPTRNPFTETTYGFRTDEIPDGEMLWSPRLGFNWDINGDGIQQLRGGAGLFAGRTPYVWISNNYARTGIEQTFLQAFGVPFVADPNNQPVVGGGSTGEFNLISPNFQFPQVWRYNLAYDRQLPWLGIVGSVEVVYSQSEKEIDYQDVNLVQTGNQPFDGRPTFARLDNSVSGAYLITNTSKGETLNAAVKLEKPFRDGWWGYVSYAYGDAKTVNDGTSSRAVSNFQFNEALDPNNAPESTSDFEVEHRFNAAISYRADWGGKGWSTTFSAFYNRQAGRPYSSIYASACPGGGQSAPGCFFGRGSVNGDGYFSNDLIYVPGGAGDVLFWDFATRGVGDAAFQASQWALLDAYISADSCLDSHRGGVAPRNCSKAPWNQSLDFRIAQDIPISRTKLQVTFDLFNLLNLIDEDSGIQRYVNFNTVSPVNYHGVQDGKPIYSLTTQGSDPDNRFETHNINSRWRARLGLRWSF